MAAVGHAVGAPVSDVPWPRLDQDGVRLRAAALEYVLHGWGVLPGSVWNGRRFTLGHVPAPAPGLVPVLPSGRTFRQPRQVWGWWSVAPYSVLARVGVDFDVATVPATLAEQVSRDWQAPVLAAGPRCWVLVPANGRTRAPDEVGELRWAERDTVVPLPPTRLPVGSVSWLVEPWEVAWRPGVQ